MKASVIGMVLVSALGGGTQKAQEKAKPPQVVHHLVVFEKDGKVAGEVDSVREVVDLAEGKFYFIEAKTGQVMTIEGQYVVRVQ